MKQKTFIFAINCFQHQHPICYQCQKEVESDDVEGTEFGVRYFYNTINGNIFCDKCIQNCQTCRTCQETFSSRNQLFRHLKNKNHMI